MKGRQLTIDKVLDLEDGIKIWVDYNFDGYLEYEKSHCLCIKKNNRLYDTDDSGEYFSLDANEEYFELYEWIEEESIENQYKEIEKYLDKDFREDKITPKEKLKLIIHKKIAIWCEEQWMADKLFKEYGDDSDDNYWDIYGSENCYTLNHTDKFFMHSRRDFYIREGYTVIRFNDFMDINKIDIEKIIK